MSDMPKSIAIKEEGPREGFQIESAQIPTAQKVALIDALSETGVGQIQIVSFVNPKKVPGMADADEVVRQFTKKPGVEYSALFFNTQGFRARARLRRPFDREGIAAAMRLGDLPQAQSEPHHEGKRRGAAHAGRDL